MNEVISEANVNGELMGVDFKEVGKSHILAWDAIICVEDWKVGDFIKVFQTVVVKAGDGMFYLANHHPQNPWSTRHGNPGYHIKKIEKRNYGSWGKIMEELEELNDAHEQGSKIMQLVELSDLYGAIEGYLEERFPGMKMHDLKKFSDITKRAFRNGERK